ncbi:ubiquitin-like modifier hub1 [Colletotrichum spaethianum]|uniref:Ubiquitin-like modifier hub1 n=1 Tax=Colletotrichum spaethianum TaxID=700344 RepID=A0AA37LGG0_9PEZI|nr:ubiquitin-like modifier hub1 [Colletotrichum spaethianum]GKT47004.1 ubiquitin-like modifier hub1 [Colletotrichum spaethianum]
MTRRKFNSDLAHASQQAVAHISDLTKGDDDGQVKFVFSDDALVSPLIIRLITLNIDEYPQGSGFLAYTDADSIPTAVSELLDELPSLSQYKSILDTLRLISRRLSRHLASETSDHSDVEMTDVEPNDNPDTEEDEEDDEYGYEDDVAFGLGSAAHSLPTPTHAPKERVKVTARLVEDLRKAKEAGFKVSLLTNVTEHEDSRIFALSLPVTHLGLNEDTLEAWEVNSSDYIVLLCRYDSGYPCVETFKDLPPGHAASMQFRFGKCASFKPTLSSAFTALNPKFNNAQGISAEEVLAIAKAQDAAFCSMPISNSIDTFLNRQLATLLKIRLAQGVSWDGATDLVRTLTRDGHLRGSKSKLNHTLHLADDTEAQVSTTARELLNKDYVRHNPHAAGPLPQNELSTPLIAMQFALRYFVKSTQYCLVCHQKTDPGFDALKPYVCSEPLCLFQYMALGLGPSIEHDIIARPYVVDLLVSFCAAGLHASRIREWPKGLAIKVPLLSCPSTPANIFGSWPVNSAYQLGQPPEVRRINPAIPVLAQISAGKFDLDSTQTMVLKPGDMVILIKSAMVGGQGSKADVHHCRIKSIDTVRNGDGNNGGRVVEFDCIMSTDRQPNVASTTNSYWSGSDGSSLSAEEADCRPEGMIDDEKGDAELLLYEYDLDELEPPYQREALMVLVQTIPSIRTLRDYLKSHQGSSLSECNKISRSALALLRWIVASNRSFIVQIDQPADLDIGGISATENRQHERVVGMTDDWMQFRFAQGSPEKENRFKEELEKQGNHRYPTLFAWHGSQLGNWHSIIRTGLDFKETLNGRAFGHGVYFARDFSTSQGYSRTGMSSWIGSELKLFAAISLCEIINRPTQFTSTSPFYVVDQVDWIQCRYLLAQRKHATETQAQKPTSTPETEYISQDPSHQPTGKGGGAVRIPVAALPRWRQKSAPPGSSMSQPIVVMDDSDDDHDNEPDDFDLMMRLRDSEEHGEADKSKAVVCSDPEKIDFVPGSLDLGSVPQLSPPNWASDQGRKFLGKELSRLQKLQAKTPLHQIGWYIDFDNITNMFQWIVELHSFEKSLPLAQDMQRLGVSSIVIEIRFGRQFPLSPPFVRVVRPRFLPFSQRGGGHVTTGGAMCMELLTNSGWSPVSSMESVLLQVRMAMCNLEPFPARLMGNTAGSSNDYGVYEAIEAYKRAAATHGWRVPPDLDMTANAQ